MLLAMLCHWKPGPEQHGPARIDCLSDRRTQRSRQRPSEKKAGWVWNSKKRTNIWILASKKGSIGALQCTTHVESCVSVMWLTANPCIIFNFGGCLCVFRCMFFAGHLWGSRLGLSVGSSRRSHSEVAVGEDQRARRLGGFAVSIIISVQFNSRSASVRFSKSTRSTIAILMARSSCRVAFVVWQQLQKRWKSTYWFLRLQSSRLLLSPSKSPTLVLLARCAWIQLPTIWFLGLCDSIAYMLHLRNYQ